MCALHTPINERKPEWTSAEGEGRGLLDRCCPEDKRLGGVPWASFAASEGVGGINWLPKNCLLARKSQRVPRKQPFPVVATHWAPNPETAAGPVQSPRPSLSPAWRRSWAQSSPGGSPGAEHSSATQKGTGDWTFRPYSLYNPHPLAHRKQLPSKSGRKETKAPVV